MNAAVSYLGRYSGRPHNLYTLQLRRWFSWCEANGLDHWPESSEPTFELYLRHSANRG